MLSDCSTADTAGNSASLAGNSNSDGSSLSSLRRGLFWLNMDDMGVDHQQQGDVVNVDGLPRVLVPMNVSGRYADDVILVPGPAEMPRDEQDLHEQEEREFVGWLAEWQFVREVVAEVDADIDNSNESEDSGVGEWNSGERENEE